MNLYIFGAGASKASQEGLVAADETPPLVDGLFDEKYYGYAELVHLSRDDLASYNSSMNTQPLEQWLTNWWEAIDEIPDVDVQYAEKAAFGKISFYIWWLMQNVSNKYASGNGYKKFLVKLKSRKEYPRIISFNYDTLLDKALSEVYGKLLQGTLDAYTKAKYIKPHGSTNWFLDKRGGEQEIGREMGTSRIVRFDTASSQMFNGSPLSLESVHVINPNHKDMQNPDFISHARFNQEYFYPLILIPLTTKLYPFFTYFDEKIVSEGKKLIAEATDIYLIGYRASDELIKEMLREARQDTKLHVVGLNSAESIKKDVLSWAPKLVEGTTYSDGFMNFVETL